MVGAGRKVRGGGREKTDSRLTATSGAHLPAKAAAQSRVRKVCEVRRRLCVNLTHTEGQGREKDRISLTDVLRKSGGTENLVSFINIHISSGLSGFSFRQLRRWLKSKNLPARETMGSVLV